jgi:tRNA (cytidine32/uridine32-2'-O)-methyltransferase
MNSTSTTFPAILLVEPTHVGNIGSVARAMKTMGLSQLILLNPPPEFPNAVSTALAAGADDILSRAKIVSTLNEALAPFTFIVGTSVRVRHLAIPHCSARECGSKLYSESVQGKSVILFGREHSGLTNEELQRCHLHVSIPTNPDFSSLNLAAAVQVLSYEVSQAWATPVENHFSPARSVIPAKAGIHKASQNAEAYIDDARVQLFYTAFQNILKDIDFLRDDHPQQIMIRLQRFFQRARLEKTEYDLWMGILKKIRKRIEPS